MNRTIITNRRTKIIKSLPVKCLARNIVDIMPSGSWQNKKCFIIGGGPSLNGFNWELLRGNKVIGINKAFMKYPSDINYSLDYCFFDLVQTEYFSKHKNYELNKKWKEYKGIKLFSRIKNNKCKFAEDIYYVNQNSKKMISYDLNAGIFQSNHSGFGAIMLAIALGCKFIGLLGYDFKINNKEGKTHWHDGYSTNIRDERALKKFESNLNNFRLNLEEFAPAILKQGILAYNLSSDSLLEGFPKLDIQSFLNL